MSSYIKRSQRKKSPQEDLSLAKLLWKRKTFRNGNAHREAMPLPLASGLLKAPGTLQSMMYFVRKQVHRTFGRWASWPYRTHSCVQMLFDHCAVASEWMVAVHLCVFGLWVWSPSSLNVVSEHLHILSLCYTMSPLWVLVFIRLLIEKGNGIIGLWLDCT